MNYGCDYRIMLCAFANVSFSKVQLAKSHPAFWDIRKPSNEVCKGNYEWIIVNKEMAPSYYHLGIK